MYLNSTNTYFQNTTGQMANTLILAYKLKYLHRPVKNSYKNAARTG